MTNAYHDENGVPTLIGVSSSDGFTPVRAWVDPTTHRLLVDSTGGGGGFTLLTPTGTINSVNTAFVFTEQPTYIVSDGAWYRVNKGWTWDSGTLTATMTIPPNDDIYGFV
jgi:hypothetical protein